MIVDPNNFIGSIGKENSGGREMGAGTDFYRYQSGQVVENIRLSTIKSTCTRTSVNILSATFVQFAIYVHFCTQSYSHSM